MHRWFKSFLIARAEYRRRRRTWHDAWCALNRATDRGNPEAAVRDLARCARVLSMDTAVTIEDVPVLWAAVRRMRRDMVRAQPFHALVETLGTAGIIILLLATLWAGGRALDTWRARQDPVGCLVTYFRGTDLARAVCRRGEEELVRDYGEQRPAWFVPRRSWSARWEGDLLVPVTTNYVFFAQSDDGIRFYIDDRPIIDNWRDQGWLESARKVRRRLARGVHRLRVEYYNRGGRGALRIRWAGGPVPRNSVIGPPYLWKPGRAPDADASRIGEDERNERTD